MRKIYMKPSIAVRHFNKENIVTASAAQQIINIRQQITGESGGADTVVELLKFSNWGN